MKYPARSNRFWRVRWRFARFFAALQQVASGHRSGWNSLQTVPNEPMSESDLRLAIRRPRRQEVLSSTATDEWERMLLLRLKCKSAAVTLVLRRILHLTLAIEPENSFVFYDFTGSLGGADADLRRAYRCRPPASPRCSAQEPPARSRSGRFHPRPHRRGHRSGCPQ